MACVEDKLSLSLHRASFQYDKRLRSSKSGHWSDHDGLTALAPQHYSVLRRLVGIRRV